MRKVYRHIDHCVYGRLTSLGRGQTRGKIMSKRGVEEIKGDSDGLRGEIGSTLGSDVPKFSDDDATLLKFHGTYQQDDRDRRRGAAGGEKAWMFMVRTKMPGGGLTSEQYLAHDDLAGSLGNCTLRLTTRQGIQLHGV